MSGVSINTGIEDKYPLINIKGKYTGEPLYNELNVILNNTISILNNSKRQKIEDKWYYTLDHRLSMRYEDYLDVLLNILYEKSNIEKILDQKRCSISIIDFKQIFLDISESKKDPKLYHIFLERLSKDLKNIKKNDFKFIFLLNVKFEDFEKNYKYITNLFGLKRFNSNKYKEVKNHVVPEGFINYTVPFKNIIEVFAGYEGEKVEVIINAGDINYATKEAKFKIESFLGLLSFITHIYGNKMTYGGVPDIAKSKDDEDYRICNIRSVFYITILENNIFWSILDHEINEIKKISEDLVKVGNLGYLRDGYRLMKDHKMFKNLRNILSLYYSAASETSLDYSFLKYWIVSELIIKVSGKKTDQQMLKIINKLHNDDSLKKRSEFLINKRNLLVHEGKVGIISQSDRNLSKLFADMVLFHYISSMKIIDENQDFDFYIRNKFSEKIYLNRRMNILKELDGMNKISD